VQERDLMMLAGWRSEDMLSRYAASTGSQAGPRRTPATKTDAGTRTLLLPRWCVMNLRERASSLARGMKESGTLLVFPAPLGGWRDPSNTQADLRDVLASAGFDWGSSQVFRTTVATVMDHAGLSSRAAADQLGHANTSMTTDVHFGRKVAATGTAAVLEALGDLAPTSRRPRPGPSAAGSPCLRATSEPAPQWIMRVAVFAGSQAGPLSHRRAAADLGIGLARAGVGIVYGGGHVGLMGSLSAPP
jgi:hypothetical protein